MLSLLQAQLLGVPNSKHNGVLFRLDVPVCDVTGTKIGFVLRSERRRLVNIVGPRRESHHQKVLFACQRLVKL
jgi:hypothetical protein